MELWIISAVLIAALAALLVAGVWIALTLLGVGWVAMVLFTHSPAGGLMATTVWGSSTSWALTALPLFIWMGEILFRTRISEDMFRGLAPWMAPLPGRLMHCNVTGCGIFAAISGSSAATAATIGVIGALVLAAASGSLSWRTFEASVMGATKTSCMIAFILAGAAFLTVAMAFTGVPRIIAQWIGEQGFAAWQLIAVLTVLYIILGCFIDGISMVVLTSSVILPSVKGAGIDLLWFGIFVVLVVEMAQITPPVGFNLFVLQGLTGRDMFYVARASLPFFILMVLAVAIIWRYPEIVTYLPGKMFNLR